MKNKITTRYLLSVTVSLLVLCANAWAGQFFFDDFSDGNMTDGVPVNWVFGEDPGGGTEGYTAADPDGAYYIYRDVSISVQIKRISDHTNNQWVSGFVCRWSDGPTGGYWIEVRPPNRFWFGHRDRYVLRSATLPFDVDETELIIRVDAVGDELKAWCWSADEPMPEEPQISFVDNVAPEGVVGFYYSPRGGQAIYRWVKVDSLEVPIVDFNGNGKVDIKDILKLINNWNQDEPSVDINGDGIVDDKDLEILMEYWDQNVDDPTLLAHWALDETEGMIAYDSAGTNDAVLSGDPVWQPTMGQLDGALELDGEEDCIIAGSVLNPADGPFSVIAWVEGGAPGQVILSKLNGSNWLGIDSDLGCLTSELACQGRNPIPLLSETVITDGEWHRTGLVYDGSNRMLYVDDVIVAQDTQASLKDSYNGLYIGTGKAMEAGTFWSGLIDDVRIYNRALKP
jgi:hypothetical protein